MRATRLSPAALAARTLPLLVALPVALGLGGTLLPAFGYLPALGGMTPSLAPWRVLLTEPGLLRSTLLALGTGFLTTFLSLGAVALFLAARVRHREGAFAAPRFLAPLLAVPHAAAAFAVALLIAPSGFLFRLAAPLLGLDRPPDFLIVGDRLGLALVLGLVPKEIPFLLLVAFAALPQCDAARRLHAAGALGYAPRQAFLFTVWPTLYRQIRLPVLAVLAFSSSVIDVSLILGPSTPPTLAVRVLGWLRDPDLALRFMGAAGALLQAGATLLLLLVWLGLERVGAALRRRMAASGRFRGAEPAPGLDRILALPVQLAAMVLAAGMALLLVWSFSGLWSFPDLRPAAFTLRTWRAAAANLQGPLASSLQLGLVSAAAATLFALALLEAVRRARPFNSHVPSRLPRVALACLLLPLLVPQIAFLFGIEVALLVAGAQPGFGPVALVHTLFVVPYVVLALADPWFALDPRYEHVASSLGKHPRATFLRIRLALLAPPLATAFAIGLSVSVAQYLPTLLIGGGRVPTLTTEAVALASGANPRIVGVTALLQSALPLLAFLAASLAARWTGQARLRRRRA